MTHFLLSPTINLNFGQNAQIEHVIHLHFDSNFGSESLFDKPSIPPPSSVISTLPTYLDQSHQTHGSERDCHSPSSLILPSYQLDIPSVRLKANGTLPNFIMKLPYLCFFHTNC